MTNRTRAETLYVALYYCRVVRISQIESLMLLNERNPWEYICHNGHAACLDVYYTHVDPNLAGRCVLLACDMYSNMLPWAIGDLIYC